MITSVTLSVLALLAMMSAGCTLTQDNASPPRVEDLVGTWMADYNQSASTFDSTGVETLVFRSDGKYQQVYSNGSGYTYESPWNNWYLDSDGFLHLEGGRWYVGGPAKAESDSKGAVLSTKIKDKDVTINLGEEILLVISTRRGATVLEHMPLGDPDSPIVVFFSRTDPGTSEP